MQIATDGRTYLVDVHEKIVVIWIRVAAEPAIGGPYARRVSVSQFSQFVILRHTCHDCDSQTKRQDLAGYFSQLR